MYENNSDNGTFYSEPKGIYTIIIIRVTLENHQKFLISFFTLSLKKDEETYIEIFRFKKIIY